VSFDCNIKFSADVVTPVALKTFSELRNDIIRQLDTLYVQIVDSLCSAADSCVPVIAEDYFKYWWDEEMNILKSNSCTSHTDWQAAGRPGSGPIYEAKRVAKAVYKRRIREHKVVEMNSVSNSLHEVLLSKSQNNF
jgi:hypothetical protein